MTAIIFIMSLNVIAKYVVNLAASGCGSQIMLIAWNVLLLQLLVEEEVILLSTSFQALSRKYP